jgi:tRNA1Val (adenine37-N6)-methyltransferase
MANSFFAFKQFTIHQGKSVFKVTTDACILGAYVNLSNLSAICDIGTGTGILSLMMAQKFSGATIEAIEIHPISAIQAKENIQMSPWNMRISVYNESIQRFARKQTNKYDLIICNPPYFEDQMKSKNPGKNLARHNYRLSINVLAETMSNLLNQEGWCYVILPPISFNHFYPKMKMSGFELNDKLVIYSAPDKPVNRIIGGFSKLKISQKENRLFIYDHNGYYTSEFKNLLKDYYLAF